MAVAVKIDGIYPGASVLGVPDTTEREAIYQGALTLSGNYGTGTSHGDTLSFANIPGLLSQTVPLRVEIYEQPAAGTAPSFYSAIFQPGSTIANGAVNFSLAGTEYTEGSAYSGAIASAVWKFRAWFPQGK
jgi:hypothetical protein